MQSEMCRMELPLSLSTAIHPFLVGGGERKGTFLNNVVDEVEENWEKSPILLPKKVLLALITHTG